MKINKIMILTIVLLAIMSFGAVSAQDNSIDDVNSANDAIQLNSIDSDNLASDNYDKSIYVDNTGSDSAAGNQSSPYASLNKAISQANASQNVVINLAEGTYLGENNTDLSINLAHKQNNGSLTIIGKGIGKTIIDADYASPIFKSIGADSIVTLVNITFTHGKNNLGSAITTSADLTIDSCEFIRNEASAYAAVYQTTANNLKITNSKFKDNVANSGNAALYYSVWGSNNYTVTISDSIFENSTTSYAYADSSCVYIQAGNVLVQRNTFINISGTGKGSALYVRGNSGAKVINNTFKDSNYTGTNDGGILYIGDTYLEGNTFENCTTSKGALIYSLLTYNAKIVYDDLLINGTSFKLTATLSDDKGNLVNTYGDVIFYLGSQKLGTAKATSNGIATLSLSKLLDNGQYTLTGSYADNNNFKCEVTNATVTVNFDHTPIDLWISPVGDDENGTGSSDKPFKTIKHALDYGLEKSIDVKVHLVNGLYNETGDFALSYSDVAKITIVGESKENVIISGNTNNVFLTSGVNTEVLLKNLTIKDLAGYNSFNVRVCTFENCIVDNVKRVYAQTSPSHVVFKNVCWTNSDCFVIYNGEIYDSYFENITSGGTGNFWLATVSNDDEIIVKNSKFINMKCTGYSGTGVLYVQGNFLSVNNTFYNNTATRDNGVLYVSGNNVISINDTFTNNHADGSYGVGSFFNIKDNPTLRIENAKFINNTAGSNGGAIAIYGGELINCTFENNTASANGGAIFTPTHSSSIYLYDLTLEDVTFKGNKANNGQDIFITPATNANNLYSNLIGMTVTFNDLSTKTLQDTVRANVTHKSGAVIGGGSISFTLGGSVMGVANVVDGIASLDYLGFTKDGTFILSGNYNVDCNDTKYTNATVRVTLDPLKDNVTVYVSQNGNDSIADGSLQKPFKTINAALNYGYKQSRVILVYILEGNYSGDGNINLTIFDSLDISIVGDGVDKTVITGNATKLTWFIKLLNAGEGLLKLANMTVSEINYNYKAQNSQTSAIVTEKDTLLIINNVKFTKNAGNNGGVINNLGELEIYDSIFFNNGDSNYGASVYNAGKTTINNSKFIANHAKYYGDFYSTGELNIYNSLIQDSMRVNGWAGNAFALGGSGNITIINSTISRSGKTVLEIIEAGDTYADNPAFVISIAGSGNVLLDNITIDGNNKAYSGPSVAATASIGVTSTAAGVNYAPVILEIRNSKFLNINTVFANQKNAIISGSVFENITTFISGTSFAGNITVTASYFADENIVLTKHSNSIIKLNNNWWRNNSQPTYKASNVETHPDTWLILTLNTTENGEAILAFKSFDGENITDFDDLAYPREFTIDAVNATLKVNNGTIANNAIIPLTSSEGKGLYLNASVDGQNVNLTRIFTEISAVSTPVHYGQNATVEITSPDDLKNNITLIINGKTYSSSVNGSKTIITVPNLEVGVYNATVKYDGDDVYLAKSVSVNVKVIAIIINVGDVEKYFMGSQKLNITVVDGEGAVLANQKVTAVIGNETLQATTNSNGIASFDLNMSVGSFIAEISLNKTNASAKILIKSTISIPGNEAVMNVDNGFEVKYVDGEGKPLTSTSVVFDVDGKKITKTTDANGAAKLTKQEIGADGTNHIITVVNPINNETISKKVSISKPAPVKDKIVLKAKKSVNVKKSAKKLVLSVTLKINGKTVKGKKVKFTFNKKTYSAKTNKKGVAKVTITKKIIKKLKAGKKYTAKITYTKNSVKTVVKVKK